MINKLIAVGKVIQDIIQFKGGTYVDLFAIVFILRLLGPFKGYPAMNPSEAGMWAATIAAFAYSNPKGS